MFDSMDVSLSKLWEMVKDREARRVAVHGVIKKQNNNMQRFTKKCDCKG